MNVEAFLPLLAQLAEGHGYPLDRDPTWTCGACDHVLGLIDFDGTVRWKSNAGPVYVALTGQGQILLSCPRCAAVCTLTGAEVDAVRNRNGVTTAKP